MITTERERIQQQIAALEQQIAALEQRLEILDKAEQTELEQLTGVIVDTCVYIASQEFIANRLKDSDNDMDRDWLLHAYGTFIVTHIARTESGVECRIEGAEQPFVVSGVPADIIARCQVVEKAHVNQLI